MNPLENLPAAVVAGLVLAVALGYLAKAIAGV